MFQCKNHIWMILILILLGGCSNRTVMMPTPHLYSSGEREIFENLDTALQTSRVNIMYFTDRQPEFSRDGSLGYGAERSNSLAFGSVLVDLGNNLSWNELMQISTESAAKRPRTYVDLVSLTEQGRLPETPYSYRIADRNSTIQVDPDVLAQREFHLSVARDEILRRLADTRRKEILVFIHGVNYSYKETMEMVAESWHFLGREGVPIAYTWPTKSGSNFSYAYDRESGEFTIFHLKSTLRFLASLEGVEKIHLVGHSRGTDVLMTAIRELYIETRTSDTSARDRYKIGNVVLIAPDLDFQVSMQRLYAESLEVMFERMTIYTNAEDDAIGAAKAIFKSLVRLGALRRDKLSEEQKSAITRVDNLDIITYEGARGGRFGHGYFLANPAVSSDIYLLLRYGASPGKENGRPLVHLGENFWLIRDGYPQYESASN